MKYSITNLVIIFIALFAVVSCNYNYHIARNLEKEKRYEEANIEYQRAFTRSPSNDNYKLGYLRTAKHTAESLLARYDNYLGQEKYKLAYQRLKQAQTLAPDHPKVNGELRKWYLVLLAGKIDFQFKTLKNQIPLTDRMILEIQFNTSNAKKKLTAQIDYQTRTFSVEDIVYDPNQDLSHLMFYSINSIGVRLISQTYSLNRYEKFIDFKAPLLKNMSGSLSRNGDMLTPIRNQFSSGLTGLFNEGPFWYPSEGIQYSLEMDRNKILVQSEAENIDFLPQVLYMNRKNQRFFFDFGKLEIYQNRVGGLWSFRRAQGETREYIGKLKENLLLDPYLYYRDGAFPFIRKNS
ncbi:MAG: hypothetical protein OEY59_03965 [Deltaproteobacteria bacterium]|nr:hypothetical protein [Deltaproteobacteria bacterium]